MKFLFLLLSLCASFYLKAQKEITNWYDAERKQKKEVFFEKKVGEKFIREGQYIIYHKNGVTFQKGSYLNGELDGIWIIYYENRSIKENLVFKNNQLNGEAKTYYPSGKLFEISNYKNDVLNGESKVFMKTKNLMKLNIMIWEF